MPLHRTRTLQLLLIAYGFSFVAVGAIRPLFGESSLMAAAGSLAAVGITYAATRWEGLSLTALGGSRANLLRGAAVTLVICAVCLLIGTFLQAIGVLNGPILALPTTKEWIPSLALAGLAEELLFRGFLFTGLARLLDLGAIPWRAWLISALLFGLYHLPTSLWTGLPVAELLLRFALSLLFSLVLLIPLYLFSRNLWLTAFVHGVATVLVMPQVREQPIAALAFTAVALLLGRFLLPAAESLPLSFRIRATRLSPALAGAQPKRFWHVI